jgi:phage baseplate assembly protein gpV
MSSIVPALKAVVRDELATQRAAELGIVTQVYTNEGGSGDTNLAVNLRVRGSALELQHVPVAVGRLGLSAVPRVGDLAVVVFVGGDLNGPVVLGFLYDEQTRPPDGKASEIVYKVPDDAADDDRRIEVQLPSGNTLTLQDKKLTVTMGGTTLTVEADGAITLDAAGDLKLKAGGSVSIEAGTDATLKAGTSVTVEGQVEAKLKGVTTSIAGMTSFSSG